MTGLEAGISGVGELKAGRELDHLIAWRVFRRRHASIGSQPLDYSTDIRAAWGIVDRLSPSHLLVNIVTLPGGFWRVSFFDIDEDDHANRYGEASASSAPLAICLAALDAIVEFGEPSPAVLPNQEPTE